MAVIVQVRGRESRVLGLAGSEAGRQGERGKWLGYDVKSTVMAEIHIPSITDVIWYVNTILFLHGIQLTVIDSNDCSRFFTAQQTCAAEKTREHINCVPRPSHNFDEAFMLSHSTHTYSTPHRNIEVACNIKSRRPSTVVHIY